MDKDKVEALLPMVRRKLRITYEDADTDALLRETIEDAGAALARALGVPDGADPLAEPGDERSLLKSLCFYAWNDAEDEFWANYAQQLASCREKWMVTSFVEESKQAADL